MPPIYTPENTKRAYELNWGLSGRSGGACVVVKPGFHRHRAGGVREERRRVWLSNRASTGTGPVGCGRSGGACGCQTELPPAQDRWGAGAAVRFVHGGCTLQEIVIPVIEVDKRRTSDVSQVEIELLPGTSPVISSGQLAVALYQTSPVTDKVQPRTLRLGLYAGNGELISDVHELTFDFRSDNPRERELKPTFRKS